MFNRLIRVLFLLCFSSMGAVAAPVEFTRDIQPILAKHCVQCHGANKPKSGLKLETGAQVLKGSLYGPVIVAKNSKASKLILALRGQGELEQMPPTGALKENEIVLIARWIDEGAVVPQGKDEPLKHWAFEKPVQRSVPANVHPIDYFLDIERKQRGITTAPTADRDTLLRRLTLDLTGLPPTPEELKTFRENTEPKALERRIDALLASPQHGERWARHFLDIWRYSDWYGYGNELRNSQKGIWNWRDWVVDSINENKPYDRMIREMLAGDEIAPLDPKIFRATGYLARSYYKFNRNVWLDDIVEHTGKAFLGITMNCCRCHDHMYDPLPQEDYYRFRAIFEPHQIRSEPISELPRVYDADLKVKTYLFERGDDKRPRQEQTIVPGSPVAFGAMPYAPKEFEFEPKAVHPTLRDDVRQNLRKQAESAIASAKSPSRRKAAEADLRLLNAKLAADASRFARPPLANTSDSTKHAVTLQMEVNVLNMEADLADAEDALKKLDSSEKKNEKAIATAKKKRDDLTKSLETTKQAKAPADYPPLMPSYPERTTGRRKALAEWIAHKDNPLTARVLVNHVWLRHFGQPLVPRVFDFGKNGRPPSHPALLDWLAVEFMKSNWDIRWLHQVILTSKTYQLQSSFPHESNRKIDPDNIYLARMNPRPLEAEAIRDSLIFHAGLLDSTFGGPELENNEDATKLRRSLYYRHAPEKMMPFLAAFDNPSPTECYSRPMTVVPQQAMALLNSKLAERASISIAKSLTMTDKVSIVKTLYFKLLSREPGAEELRLCVAFLEKNSTASLVKVLFNHAEYTTIR